jgi:hypothetical protein
MPAGVKQGQKRNSGQPVASEIAKEEADKVDQPVEQAILPDERETKFRTPGFSRMRIEWSSDDRPVIDRAQQMADGVILRAFEDAYEVMYQVYNLVREPDVDTKTGEIKVDKFGMTVWKRTPSGGFDEDFTRLGRRQKEDLLFKITTRLFDWEQRAANIWMDSMVAKAQWEERFSIGFDAPMAGTVDDRRAAGNLDARDERYFAIFQTALSRKADAIVRSMTLLAQRLKDSME